MLKLKKILRFYLEKKPFSSRLFFIVLLFFVVLIPNKVLGEHYIWKKSFCHISTSVNIMPDPLENWCPGGVYGVEIGSSCPGLGAMSKLKCLKEITPATTNPYDMYIFDCAGCFLCSYCTAGCGDYSCASTERPINWDCSDSGSGEYSYNSCTYDCVQSSSCMPNQIPTASITEPSGNRTITAGDWVKFSGTGSDSDGSITSYRWNLGSCTGTQIHSSQSFVRTFSTAGTYRIYLRVQDNDGAWSTNCPYRTITVSSPTCTASCGSWSICSASCDGGTQTRTCRRTDCSTYTQSQACNTQACCVPSCSCALNTCVGNTCSDGCGGTCSGTGTCNLSGYSTINHSCSSNILTTTERWYSYYCISGGCSSPVLVDSSSSTDPCDTGESCTTGTPMSRCKDVSTVENYKAYTTGTCNSSGGSCDNSIQECENTDTTCEEGYVCKETGTDQAECVPKATTWTEI